jgi:ribonuclease III
MANQYPDILFKDNIYNPKDIINMDDLHSVNDHKNAINDISTLSVYNKNNKEITEKDIIVFLKQYNLPTELFNINIFKRAFVHSSYVYTEENVDIAKKIIPGVMPLKHKSNERLEFVGDGIVEAVTKFYLYKRFPMKDEGFMTETKIALVKNESLGKLVQRMGIHKWFIISKEAEEKGLRNNVKKLGCLFEAFVGALFLNFNKIMVDDEDIINHSRPLSVMSGYTVCTNFIETVFERFVNWNELLSENSNYKNLFQVIIQKEFKVTPDYILLNGEYDEQTKMNKPQSEYHSCVVVCCGNTNIHNTNIDSAVHYSTLKSGFEDMKHMMENHGGFMIRFGDHRHSTKKIAEQEACRMSIQMIKSTKKVHKH